jgi:hypothetical protein
LNFSEKYRTRKDRNGSVGPETEYAHFYDLLSVPGKYLGDPEAFDCWHKKEEGLF